MTVYLVVSLPKYRIHMVLTNLLIIVHDKGLGFRVRLGFGLSLG